MDPSLKQAKNAKKFKGMPKYQRPVVFFSMSLPSLELTFSPLKIGRNPKGNDRLPTIHFQGAKMLVSGRIVCIVCLSAFVPRRGSHPQCT